MLCLNILCSIPIWIVDYMNDLPALCHYACAQATHKCLMEDVPQTAARVQTRYSGKKTNAGYSRGCVVDLNIWYYKIISTSKKVLFGKTPRMLCYREDSFRKQGSLGPLVTTLDGKKVLSCLMYVMYKHFLLKLLFLFNILCFHLKW